MKTAKDEAVVMANWIKALSKLPLDTPVEILQMCADSLAVQRVRVQVALRNEGKL